MAFFKCKMCGGELELQQDSNVAECLYCGSRQTVPHIENEKKLRLYSRAIQYRLDNEFEKAYNAYESIISEKEDEAEAYWGLVLSEYGVEYVEDPATKKRIPTCHRTLVKSVTSNENYKLACKYADSESRMMYEDEAEELDALQKKILTAAAKEDPYDVFICYKETDKDGQRTPDSVLAQEIYDELTKHDFRVFFARITLEDKLGKDYEPCIYSALTSAKVMLMVTTDSDHCNAVWVKNEWKRYIEFMKSDSEKVLIPVYRDISPYALPDEFSKLQAQDMSKLGAVQDLVRGVEKILGKNRSGGQSGLGAREKELLHNLEKKEKRKSILFKIAAAVGIYLFCIVWGTYYSKMAPAYYVRGMQISMGAVLQNAPLFMVTYATITATYIALIANWMQGLKSKIANFIYMLTFVGYSIFLIVGSMINLYPSKYILAAYILLAILTIVSMVFVFGKDKKKLKIPMIITVVLLVVSLLFSGISPRQENGRDNSKKQIEIVHYTLNVREKPSVESDKVGVLNKGEVYNVLETVETEDYTWYKIKTNFDIVGYVASGENHAYVKLLSTDEAEGQSNERDESKNQIEISASHLSIYDSMSEQRNVLGKVYKDEIYTVQDVSVSDGKVWYKIKTELDLEGYVYRELIETGSNIKEYTLGKVSMVCDERNENMWQIKVACEYRNVRKEPGTGNNVEIVGCVYLNEIYNVIEVVNKNNELWAKIDINDDVIGYVSLGRNHEYFEYLPANGDEQSNELDSSKEQIVLSRTKCLYESPSDESKIVAILFEGEIYDIINSVREESSYSQWYEVKTSNGVSGYVKN